MIVFKEIKKRTNVGMSFHHLAFDPFKPIFNFRLRRRWLREVSSGRIPWPTWGQDVRRIGDCRHDIDLDGDCPKLWMFFPTVG